MTRRMRNIFALDRNDDYLRVSTVFIAITYFILGCAYIFPNEFVRAPIPADAPPRVNIVMTVDSLTGQVPLWPVAFLIAGILLIASLWWTRYTVTIHLAGLVISVMYFTASILSAMYSPGTYIVAATFALFFAAMQWLTFDGVGAEQDSIARALDAEPMVGEGLID